MIRLRRSRTKLFVLFFYKHEISMGYFVFELSPHHTISMFALVGGGIVRSNLIIAAVLG